MVPGMALMKRTVIKREYISKFVSVVKWRIKFASYIDVPVICNNFILFYFILLDLPTRAGSPQQRKPITVGPFT
jgi:hypothetical protein